MKQCPRCGSKEYYIKARAKGIVSYIKRFDGEEADNSSMYESLDYVYYKYAYCFGCDKKLFKITEMENKE